MGVGAKKRSSESRKKEKKRRKEQKAALYKSYSELGKQKNHNKTKKQHAISSIKGSHVMKDCGNIGCEACYPQYKVVPKNFVKVA